MKLKHIVAAALLAAAASSANAAIDTDDAGNLGAGDGSGELFVSVFRNVTGQEQSYLIDTGITASSLLSGSVASGTILGNVGSFFSTAPTSSFVFNAGAVANNAAVAGNTGSIFTTNNASGAQAVATNADFSSIGALNVNMQTFTSSANAGSTDYANNNDFANISAGGGGYHGRTDWNSTLGGAVAFSTEGSLDTALSLWAVVANADFTGWTRVSLGFLTAESGTGNIVYSNTPQVPLPAAVWLLGSALVGMSAIRRRRQGAAAVAAA